MSSVDFIDRWRQSRSADLVVSVNTAGIVFETNPAFRVEKERNKPKQQLLFISSVLMEADPAERTTTTRRDKQTSKVTMVSPLDYNNKNRRPWRRRSYQWNCFCHWPSYLSWFVYTCWPRLRLGFIHLSLKDQHIRPARLNGPKKGLDLVSQRSPERPLRKEFPPFFSSSIHGIFHPWKKRDILWCALTNCTAQTSSSSRSIRHFYSLWPTPGSLNELNRTHPQCGWKKKKYGRSSSSSYREFVQKKKKKLE